MNKKEKEFLDHSNRIENERSHEALEDACEAWGYQKGYGSFSCKAILQIHKFLMARVRPDIAGRIRDCDVSIGNRKCLFVSERLIKDDLRSLCANMNNTQVQVGRDAEEFAKLMHIEFEHIHPFEDGNGRVGRIIWQAHRLFLGLPIQIIHEGAEQKSYYRWFG